MSAPTAVASGEVARWAPLPTHLDLPDSDGAIVENFLEQFLNLLLTDSIWPTLERLHPDGNFCVGSDSGIYWRITDPPLEGCKAPDWFYVPDVPATLDGQVRRSYVLWQEVVPPAIILEYVSRDGSDERDKTPWKGKFWVYERAIRPAYYGIFEPEPAKLEMHVLQAGRFIRMEPNSDGRYPLPLMGGVQLGLWKGKFKNLDRVWPRWWGPDGSLLLVGDERTEQERKRAEQEQQRAEQERQRAEQERQRADRERQYAQHLAAKLREMGVDPDKV